VSTGREREREGEGEGGREGEREEREKRMPYRDYGDREVKTAGEVCGGGGRSGSQKHIIIDSAQNKYGMHNAE
jgi:hypothetical protein